MCQYKCINIIILFQRLLLLINNLKISNVHLLSMLLQKMSMLSNIIIRSNYYSINIEIIHFRSLLFHPINLVNRNLIILSMFVKIFIISINVIFHFLKKFMLMDMLHTLFSNILNLKLRYSLLIGISISS